MYYIKYKFSLAVNCFDCVSWLSDVFLAGSKAWSKISFLFKSTFVDMTDIF